MGLKDLVDYIFQEHYFCFALRLQLLVFEFVIAQKQHCDFVF